MEKQQITFIAPVRSEVVSAVIQKKNFLGWLYTMRKKITEMYLKGQCHEIFCFRCFFYESCSLNLPKITLGSVRISGVNDTGGKFATVSTIPAANLPPVSKTATANLSPVSLPISNWWHLKGNFKEKIHLYVNSTNQRCPIKIIKTFLIANFSFATRCQRHRWCTLSC